VVRSLGRGERIQVPAAVALFDYPCPREWAERAYGDLRRFTDMPAAAESVGVTRPHQPRVDLTNDLAGGRPTGVG
jgi:hypothetical protein